MQKGITNGLRVGAAVRHVPAGDLGVGVGEQRNLVAPLQQAPHKQVDNALDAPVDGGGGASDRA